MNNIKIKQSKSIKDYKTILEGLVDDFGYDFYPSILMKCGLIKDDGDPTLYWDIWLITYNDKPVGICGFYTFYETTEELWLSYFGVLSKYRNKNIGGYAIEWMKSKAKLLGCKSLKAYLNNDQVKSPLQFYQRHGFKKVSTVKQYLKNHPELDMSFFDYPKHLIIEYKIS